MIRKKNFMSLQALFILDAIDKCGGKRKVSEILGLSIDTINISQIWKMKSVMNF